MRWRGADCSVVATKRLGVKFPGPTRQVAFVFDGISFLKIGNFLLGNGDDAETVLVELCCLRLRGSEMDFQGPALILEFIMLADREKIPRPRLCR
jgi:hypothetical protein